MQRWFADGGKILGATGTVLASCHLLDFPKIAPWAAVLVLSLLIWFTSAAYAKGPTDA